MSKQRRWNIDQKLRSAQRVKGICQKDAEAWMKGISLAKYGTMWVSK